MPPFNLPLSTYLLWQTTQSSPSSWVRTKKGEMVGSWGSWQEAHWTVPLKRGTVCPASTQSALTGVSSSPSAAAKAASHR